MFSSVVISVLFIAYHFPPGGGAGVQRSHKFVRYLPTEGFNPIIITGPGALGDRWTPTDNAMSDEFSSNTKVVRARGPIPQDGRLRGRLGRWIGLPSLFSNWWIKAAAQTSLGSIDDAKLILATMSPFATADAAQQVSQHTGIPWIADLRDPWALDEMQIYASRMHRKLELNRMGTLLSTAAGIIMNTPEATAALLERFPSFKKKPVTTITNGYDRTDFAGECRLRQDGKFRIVHTGYLHTDLGLELRRKRRLYQLLGGIEADVDILTRSHFFLLKAVAQWISQRAEVADDLEIVFAGVASEQDKAVATNCDISRCIRFTDYVSHSESVNLIRTADLLFLPMHNMSAGRRARIVPGKTYEYMAAARPILAAVPEGDARDYLQESGVAFISKPDDVEGMIQQVDRVYSAWKRGVSIVTPNWNFIQKFERSKLTHTLAVFFNQILLGHSAS